MFRILLSKANKSKLQYYTDNVELDNYIRSAYTIDNPNIKHMKKSSSHSNDTISAITPLGSFDSGLAVDIVKIVRKMAPNERIIMEKEVLPIIQPMNLNGEIIQPVNEKYVLHDHQYNAVELALRHGRGVFEHATSAGKSLIIYSIIENIRNQLGEKYTLIIVPSLSLVHQFKGDLIDYGYSPENISILTGKAKFDGRRLVIISNIQYLQNNMDKVGTPDVIIVDEAHSIKPDNEVTKIVSNAKTNIRFGFTGTIPPNMDIRWKLFGVCGPLLDTVKPFELQNKNLIAQINITSLCFDHGIDQPNISREEAIVRLIESTKAKRKTIEADATGLINLEIAKARFPLEMNTIENNYKFTIALRKLCGSLQNNTIVLFDHIEHGKIMFNEMQKQLEHKTIMYIDGQTPNEEREQYKAIMEANDNCVLIGNTKCIGTGVSIKNIVNVVFAFSSGTSNSKILQAIGRGLRLKEGKTYMNLYDIHHSFRYSKQHYEERKEMYIENYKIQKYESKIINLR